MKFKHFFDDIYHGTGVGCLNGQEIRLAKLGQIVFLTKTKRKSLTVNIWRVLINLVLFVKGINYQRAAETEMVYQLLSMGIVEDEHKEMPSIRHFFGSFLLESNWKMPSDAQSFRKQQCTGWDT